MAAGDSQPERLPSLVAVCTSLRITSNTQSPYLASNLPLSPRGDGSPGFQTQTGRHATCVCVRESIILRMAWRPEESPSTRGQPSVRY